MCTLAIYFQVAADWPVIIAANRDEFLERPATDPGTLHENPHVVGGKDLRAGGTWLGISEYGLVAGLLNRRADGDPNPNARSRGMLCLDALCCSTAADAARFAGAERGENYNPFNLLMASREEAHVAHNRGSHIEVVSLAPGLHLLSNLDVDDFECPKISRAYGRFADLAERPEFRRDPIAMRSELGALLTDHSTQLDPRSGRPNALCLHLDAYGTRSSSLIFLGREPGRIEHFFAPGAPCKTAYKPAIVPRSSADAVSHGSK
ncbi:MAG: NRDE family protein [Candidatus Binataceae bacterium]